MLQECALKFGNGIINLELLWVLCCQRLLMSVADTSSRDFFFIQIF